MDNSPGALTLPLAWRACAALDGEEPFEVIREYAKAANTALEPISRDLSDDRDRLHLDELRMFLRTLEQALSPTGATRRGLVPQMRRGRPRQSLDKVRRGMAAAFLVSRLVAEGWKQEAAIAQVGEQLGIGRTELFKWLKRNRNFEVAFEDLYSD